MSIVGATLVVARAVWADVPGTTGSAEDGLVCPYAPSSKGEYRLVTEMSIDGVLGKYASNVFVQ